MTLRRGMALTRPRGLLFDYGGTLVEEREYDAVAGIELLLSHATHRPPNATLDAVLARADRVMREVAARRDRFQIETPWTSLTRLIHDYFAIRFDAPLAELELPFWNAAVRTNPMPGAREALRELHRQRLPMGVVSNSSFGQHVIRHELAKHGLADHLAVVVVSAEYAVRKPSPLLFEAAAALLGIDARDVWFVGDRLDTDVAGAHLAGMTTVWYAPPSDSDAGQADLVVSGWPVLLEWFL